MRLMDYIMDECFLEVYDSCIQQMQLDLEVKQELEQIFVFKSLLGQGSFGCVYECEDKRDGQIYAVKIIAKSNVKKSRIQCLRQEARLLSSINHPNIVKVYEFVETNTFIYLRMEIIRNGTLGNQLSDIEKLIKQRWDSGKKFTDDEKAAVMGSLFQSLNYIHSINIIHRDIKPENILVSSFDDLSKVKMADFGLSTKLDFFYPKTATSKCGTMLYMAPEILNNLSYTKSVDIWSCSIIMFYLFEGRHPFYQSKMTTEDYKRKIKTVVFPPLSNSLAQDFLCRISKVQASQRYTTQEALKHPWLTRKFDEQIPQSLHESFLGFEKSHTISSIFKLLLTAKNICQGPLVPSIPESYALKINEQLNSSYSMNLKKTKSRKAEKQKNSLSVCSKSSTISSEVELKENQDRNLDKDTPALAKLNAIFDTLLERKPRQKQKFYTQNQVPCRQVHEIKQIKQVKQIRQSPPKTLPYKQKLQHEIERLVRQFKGEETNRTLNQQIAIRKMLPNNKKKVVERFVPEKQQFRISSESSGSNSLFKIRHRKKITNNSIKLYQ